MQWIELKIINFIDLGDNEKCILLICSHKCKRKQSGCTFKGKVRFC